MEAPKPIILQTPNKVVNYKEFYNYGSYYLKISYINDDELNIISYDMEKLDNNRYEIKINIQEIYELNNIFRQYISIKDIYNLILDLINAQKCDINKNSENNLIFSFSISDIKRINHKIELILFEENDTNYYKEYINILSNEIRNLRKDNCNNNDNYIREIKELKDEVKYIKDILSKNNIYDIINKEDNQNNNKLKLCLYCGCLKDLKKCFCGKYYCFKCISNNKNIKCKKNCYLFDNGLNRITAYYQISKFPLPKNFEAKIKYTQISRSENIRIGITFDSNIINEKNKDLDEPPYNIYYKGKRFYTYEKGWSDHFKSEITIKEGDDLIIKVKDGNMSYFHNDVSLGDPYPINNCNNKEMHLLIHKRKDNLNCQLLYIYELID